MSKVVGGHYLSVPGVLSLPPIKRNMNNGSAAARPYNIIKMYHIYPTLEYVNISHSQVMGSGIQRSKVDEQCCATLSQHSDGFGQHKSISVNTQSTSVNTGRLSLSGQHVVV